MVAVADPGEGPGPPLFAACFRDVKNAAIKRKGLDELQNLPVLASILNDQLNQTP